MNAKERFNQTRHAVMRLDEIHLLIMFECDDWKPEDAGRVSGTVSDPTANAAIRNVDEIAGRLDALRAEETELTNFIGESLAIIRAVKKGFGEIYAMLLEARYIDLLSWKDVHEITGIKKSKGHYLLNIAFDWVDSVGITRILNGQLEV